jgi:CheY-like chemotaxis protein
MSPIRRATRGHAARGARIAAPGAAIFRIDPRGAGRYSREVVSDPIVEGRPRRVLVVDDERHVRFMLCDVLTQWGCQADGVTNATEGLERLEPGAYDLLLTDFRMPGMNGVEFIEHARKRNGALRVIMLSGSGSDLYPAAQRLGFTLLRKPLDIGRLKSAIDDETAHSLR